MGFLANNKSQNSEWNTVKKAGSVPDSWRKPPFTAKISDDKNNCSCALYINDESMRRMLLGEVLICEACGSRIWLDDQFRLFDPEGLKIWYAHDRKWLIVRLWYLDFWFDQGLESGFYEHYRAIQTHPERLHRTGPTNRGERSSEPESAAMSSMLRTGHP